MYTKAEAKHGLLQMHHFDQAVVVATPDRGPRCRHRRGACWFLPFHPSVASQSWVRLQLPPKHAKNVLSAATCSSGAARGRVPRGFELVRVGETARMLKKSVFFGSLAPQRGAAITASDVLATLARRRERPRCVGARVSVFRPRPYKGL